MSENIMQFPTRLDKLAAKIHFDIERRAKSDADWIEATLALCEDLYDARREHPSNVAFGEWFDASGFNLNGHDRAAAIAMGENIDLARKIIEKTESRSLKNIRYEFDRFVHADKTDETETKQNTDVDLDVETELRESMEKRKAAAKRDGRKTRTSPKYDKAVKAVANMVATGEEPTVSKVMRVTGVGKTVAEKACIVHETKERMAAKAAPEVAPEEIAASLSMTAREKLEASLKAYQRELDARFDEAVRQACVAWSEDHGIAGLIKKLDSVERMVMTPLGAVMHKDEYFILSRCVHTDTARTRTNEQLNEAFNILRKYRVKLINDEEERIAARRALRSNMPKTVAEMIARKKKG